MLIAEKSLKKIKTKLSEQLLVARLTAVREFTNRSATELGLKPEQAQDFIKGMYKNALTKWGYDVDQIKW